MTLLLVAGPRTPLARKGPIYPDDTTNNPFAPNSVPFSSNTAGEGLMPVTRTPIYSNYIGSRAFSPSHDAGNTSLAPTFMSSPSASSDMQVGITKTQAYSSDNYLVQYPDYVVDNSYTRQPIVHATGVTNIRTMLNTMYDATHQPKLLPFIFWRAHFINLYP
ncbi:hypothetical protein EV421DRAFT_1902503 [Armillaria borealis]|uniref:Uncharacterized protein n=1 Tax=Armillaria borealis TaxID=47425 RepID=A0AA39JMN5_9AGAR|nr:hypothetical protein EV421DRAFT_1902503 [Armillaria borealis]